MTRIAPPRRLSERGTPAGRLLDQLPPEPDAPEVEQAWQRNVWRRLKREPVPQRHLWWLAPVTAGVIALSWVALRSPTPPALPAAEPALRLQAMTGSVQQSPAAGQWDPVQPGQQLAMSSPLRTDEKSRALLELPKVAEILLQPSSALELQPETRLELSSGGIVAHVTKRPAGHPFLVELHGVQLTVVGTIFSVSEGPHQSVSVSVSEGIVQVRDTTGATWLVGAGQSWSSDNPVVLAENSITAAERLAVVQQVMPPPPQPADVVSDIVQPPPVIEPEPPPKTAPRPAPRPAAPAPQNQYEQAMVLRSRGDYPAAAAMLGQVIARGGPEAGDALYALGRLRQRELHDPSAALQAFALYRARYPHGTLIQEVAISVIEAELQASQLDAALEEMSRFLTMYPDSERRSEVHFERGNVLRMRGRLDEAMGDYRQITDLRFADDALFYLAWCQQKQGDVDGYRSSLAEYLRRYPSGKHHAEIEAALKTRTP